MNQILYTASGKPGGPLPIQTIVRFFAFAIIVLGLIFMGEGTYAIFFNDFASDVDIDNTIPVITFAQDRK